MIAFRPMRREKCLALLVDGEKTRIWFELPLLRAMEVRICSLVVRGGIVLGLDLVGRLALWSVYEHKGRFAVARQGSSGSSVNNSMTN